MERRGVLFYSVLMGIIVALMYQFLVVQRAQVVLRADSDAKTTFRIYFRKAGEPWKQSHAGSIAIRPGDRTYTFGLGDLGRYDELRIDTSEKTKTTVTILSLHINQTGYPPLVFADDKDFAQLQPISGVSSAKIDRGLTVVSENNDPQLHFVLPESFVKRLGVADFVTPVLWACLAIILVPALFPLLHNYRFSAVFGLIALSLVLVMATISQYNRHPDEYVHVKAGKYYMNHSLPPKISDPAIIDTFSPYGVSRLHSGEMAYFFAGKFANFLEPFHFPTYMALRFFNVVLFAALIVICVRSFEMRILLVPLLLSPQIWYIFSYFNSEAFAVFLMMLVAYQMVVPTSSWNTLLDPDHDGFHLHRIGGLGLLFGLILLTKINFYFFVLFAGCYIVWRFIFGKTEFCRTTVVRGLAVLLLGGAILGVVRVGDSFINDFNKKQLLLEAREKYARPMFKPGTPLDKKFVLLQMKDRGVTLKQLILDNRWGERSFRSSVGEFGYTDVAAGLGYYDLFRYGGMLLLAVTLGGVCLRGGFSGISLAALTVAMAGVLMGVALYHAWTTDFQAQGRYLLPIVGMVCIFYYHVRDCLKNLACMVPYLFLFGLSVYGFIFVALAGIGKVGLPFFS